MILRGTDFGRVNVASGTLGFFGRGYWYHRELPWPVRPDFTGAGFVAKTTTFLPQQGNMDLLGPEADFEPRDRMPNCIYADHKNGIGLNAVGLSGPGAEVLLARGKWQRSRRPITLSFGPSGKDRAAKSESLRRFVAALRAELPYFRSPVALQINFSCPNTKHEWTKEVDALVEEIEEALEIACDLGIPQIPKINVTLAPEAVRRIMLHPECDAVCVSNTLPWYEWDSGERLRYFGTTKSPLEGRKNPWGGDIPAGGVSGAPLLPLLRAWLIAANKVDLPKPLNVGGGILSLSDAEQILRMAPDGSSLFLGSIAFLRPWRVGQIIRRLAGT